MSSMISVQPAPGRLRDFARWGVQQEPKIRTSGPREFAVPAALFADAPEEVLIGALVEGHRYISPDEDAAEGRPEPGAPELVGVAHLGNPEADAAAMVAAASPKAVEAAMSAAILAADVAALNAEALPESVLPAGEPGPPDDQPEGVFPCDHCTREFTTARGRDLHARQIHPAEEQ